MRRICLGSAIAFSSGILHAGVMSGEELARYAEAYDRVNARGQQQDDRDFRDGLKYAYYVQGALDVAVMADFLCAPSDGVKMRQIYAIVSKYLRDHPEEWNVAADVAVVKSLTLTMSCHK